MSPPLVLFSSHIQKELKGVVPSPVLKACLDEMTFDPIGGIDSDDEDDPFSASSKKKKGGKKSTGDDADDYGSRHYVDSLRLKVGRNANNSLYYVNQEKLPHDGDGLPPEERNELIANEQKSSHEKDAGVARLRDIMGQTSTLLSQPTNQEAATTLAEGEKALADLKESVEDSRQHIGNEKKRAKTKKRVLTLGDDWFKRRRICKDFLSNMEDITEGTINSKQCLAGDGQMDIESDETIIRGAMASYESRKVRGGGGRGGAAAAARGGGDGLKPIEAFIAVKMDPRGRISRVYADAE